ncbi:MAG: abortive infection system antitoxin AbiGi family protein [Candidatus Electrothrix scaldis]|nr:MAG: abortive infection system antitoxin AbiGi family protein [Candidatus Electrothrix sp. GW3-3]
MNKAKEKAIEDRKDISRFVVHLTRDDRKDFDDGRTALENFEGIIENRKVLALKPHCIHANKIPDKLRASYSVCCLSEIPLTELHLLTKYIPGRKIRLSDYGIVFSREFIISKGAQPAIYINSYGENNLLREAADTIYNIAEKGNFRQGKLRRILPYLNAMHERYDFTWEREWRIKGDLVFTPKDIVCVILPEQENKWRKKFTLRGIPIISPGWSYEKIIAEFSNQARSARRYWVSKKIRPRRKKGNEIKK